MEEKLSKKVTVLFKRTTNNRLDEICRKMDRSKSNLIRLVVSEWVEKVNK
jgi:predicted transcriptional regulator